MDGKNRNPAKQNSFGNYFKKMRKQTGLTLRQFCLKNELDPGNISRLERGVAQPPKSREKLAEYAEMLSLARDSDKWYTFFDLAASCSGRIPHYVMDDDELIKKLPLVFRTLRGQRPSSEELENLMELIRKG